MRKYLTLLIFSNWLNLPTEIGIENVHDFQSIANAEWKFIYEKALKKCIILEPILFSQNFSLIAIQ